MKKTVNLTLIRHGQSQWNLENRFTGWVDVELSDLGLTEAKMAAELIKKQSLKFDHCYTSVLKRSIHTAWTILKDLDLSWLPVTKAWELNERHYGALQGLNKQETKDKYGDEQVKIWRRSYDTPPPFLSDSEVNFDSKYKHLGLNNLPKGESLKMCQERVLPYFKKSIKPQLQEGKNLLIVAHGNSLRSLIMELEKLDGKKIVEVEIETATPIIYKLKADSLDIITKNVLHLK